MLIQFRVENHRSLRDEQTLSLVAANTGSDGDDCLIRPKGLNEALLPAVALYGANASGKTNVLLALEFMKRAVLDSHRLWEPGAGVPQEPFAFSERQNATSLYEVDVLVADVRYRYGFVLSAQRIEEEWLYAWPNGRKQTWFEREGDAFDFGRHLGGENETIRGLTRSNSLYLSASAQNNHLGLLPLYGWFQALLVKLKSSPSIVDRIRGMRPKSVTRMLGGLYPRAPSEGLTIYLGTEEYKKVHAALLELLRGADTGIVDFRATYHDEGGGLGRSNSGASLHFQHQTAGDGDAWLPIEAESAGTVSLLDLALYVFPALWSGGVVGVDELEASLHPKLAGALLRLFCDHQQNPNGAQLIFTTHDTNLLGDALGGPSLRRDQIWLTEKDGSGATHLYPLTDFHPRKQENLERGYLQGRYGAVPFLDELLPDAEPV
jgi:hypothetical protein